MTIEERGRESEPLAATGILGLDDILKGGLAPYRLYLVEGNPGSGKTTLSLQFLREGLRQGERVLYVTLSETRAELLEVARSHGWDLDGVTIVELSAQADELEPDNQYTMFEPSEMELNVTTRAILAQVDEVKPSRVVVDSLSEIRLLAQNPARYRRQILALKQYFVGRRCTVMLLDDRTSEQMDLQLQSIAHGVIVLEQLAPEYGAERRRLRVSKMRGRSYRGGYHDFRIIPGGLDVFPRLVAAEHDPSAVGEEGSDRILRSGIAEVDSLLGGGVEYGTGMLLMGPAGTGKSSMATQFAKAAVDAGESAAIFTFDERRRTLLLRSDALGMDLSRAVAEGKLTIQQVDSAELSPGEFAHLIRREVEGGGGRPGVRVVVIDSLNGYLSAMPEERFLMTQLHELLGYLSNKGVVTIMIAAQHGMVGSQMTTPVDTSYVADVVVMFRYFEAQGRVRQAISVMKKRIGQHERTIREHRLGPRGIEVGPPLEQFQGVLTGTPRFQGRAGPLMGADDAR